MSGRRHRDRTGQGAVGQGSRAAPESAGRHQLREIDEAGLAAARHAERLLEAARELANPRWEAFLAPLPERLRDAPPAELRDVARRARAAYGPRDSIAEDLPPDQTLAFRDALDRLLKVLARHEAGRG
jgi:hypothetical protein